MYYISYINIVIIVNFYIVTKMENLPHCDQN